jgi:hypothetical protein
MASMRAWTRSEASQERRSVVSFEFRRCRMGISRSSAEDSKKETTLLSAELLAMICELR